MRRLLLLLLRLLHERATGGTRRYGNRRGRLVARASCGTGIDRWKIHLAPLLWAATGKHRYARKLLVHTGAQPGNFGFECRCLVVFFSLDGLAFLHFKLCKLHAKRFQLIFGHLQCLCLLVSFDGHRVVLGVVNLANFLGCRLIEIHVEG